MSKNGFFPIYNVVIRNGLIAEIGPDAFAVYAVLSHYTTADNRTCWPDIDTIASLAGLGRTTTYKALDQLESHGLIKRVRRNSGNGRLSNAYEVTNPSPSRELGSGPQVRLANSPSPSRELPSYEEDPLKKTQGRKRFKAPSVEDVSAYCNERKNEIDPQAFVDYYTQSDWKLTSGNRMKDWKAAVRNWENRRRESKPKPPPLRKPPPRRNHAS